MTILLHPWDTESYPDEAGYQARIADSLPGWAAQPFGKRSLARATCPDTGLPVFSYAVEGEEILSPYTGRRFRQGNTGYFGPKARDAEGRITQFGGDPLKFDLPPVLGRLLMQPDDAAARAFIEIPGNLCQQYHFAAVHWVRGYGLLAERLSETWRRAIADAVAVYREDRRPSDGSREHAIALSTAHDLVGEDGDYVLGGNPVDGGTENHKTMWRTSGLLYARWFGADGVVSGHPAPRAAARIQERLADFLRRLAITGNGEYDTTIYTLHAILGFLNVHDFSPDAQDRLIARLTLDYYVATYGLKCFDGWLAGASKRGGSDGVTLSDTDLFLSRYAPQAGLAVPADRLAPVQQATSTYRPNRVLYNIMTKQVPLPFSAQIARPSYHMDRANVSQETFYCHADYALGSIALGEVDNPGQQTVWNLLTRGPNGTLAIGGGHPAFGGIMGHSAHDQVLQHRGTLLLLTGPRDSGDWQELAWDLPAHAHWTLRATAAETWLYLPKTAAVQSVAWGWLVDAGSAWVGILPLGGRGGVLAGESSDPAMAKLLAHFQILVLPGRLTGCVIEVVGQSEAPMHRLMALGAPGRLELSEWPTQGRVRYRTLDDVVLDAEYRPDALRCRGTIDGVRVDWDNWANGGVHDSPYVRIGHGAMHFSDGREGYQVRCDDGAFAITAE
jgi:hypothetical protein